MMLQQPIVKHFLGSLRQIKYGSISINLPDGSSHNFSGEVAGPSANMVIHDNRAVSALALKGNIGLAESFRDGWWDTEDLSKLIQFGLKNEEVLGRYISGSFLARIVSRFAHLFTRNTLHGSKKNIHAHYDLGNEFYKLWLDPTMTYSSALFANAKEDLISAQLRKYDRIIERLDASGTLLEIGCGWGGFAERALDVRDYAVKGLTISNAQYDYASKRLKGDAKIVLEDYRLQQGKYDQIVSIEMFEAVGEQYWPIYFNKLKSLLTEKGKAILQTITIKDQYFESYRKKSDPIRTFIFPGGMLPSPERFVQASNTAGFSVTDQFSFGKDYALTLKHWLNQFENQLNAVKALGFDEKFIRMWRFYLTFCIAGFASERTDVMQMELQHAK